MIVVLASRHDAASRKLADRWSAQGGCLLTCEDLSVAGWRYHPGQSSASTAVIGGREIALDDVCGVLTRLPFVSDLEILDIAPSDRGYVAAEMSAFLVCLLTGLSCPVLNRPTPGCLTGPVLRPLQWTVAAARAGMVVRPPSVPAVPEEQPVTVTVVGDRCFGSVDQALSDQARRLARAVGVGLLGVRFSWPHEGAAFVSGTLCPDLDAPELADAALAHLLGAGVSATRP